jgi:hypothetical protein
MLSWIVTGAAVAAAATIATVLLVRPDLLWIAAYLWRSLGRWRFRHDGPIHVFLCVADHYEPAWNGADYAVEVDRVAQWVRRYPGAVEHHRDADGRPPQHTFFYPGDQYRPEHLEQLARLCRAGYGDVEIHLHHGSDTSEGVRQKLEEFRDVLHRDHGLLRRDPQTGRVTYAFIHGDWALDNSRSPEYCGVNDELSILRDSGCYADLTQPAAPTDAQTRKVNSIYYATDDPARPRSHDWGRDVAVGQRPCGDLLMIQGPLAPNWKWRKWGVLPRLENGELSGDNPPTPLRADLWIRQHIHVKGRPDWVFVKLHTHGAQERNMQVLLDGKWGETLSYLEREYNDGQRYQLHYVTAREMFATIKAAERGESWAQARAAVHVAPVPVGEVHG